MAKFITNLGKGLVGRLTGKVPVPKLTHYKKGAPLEYVLSALLKLLRKGAPFYDQR